MVAPIRTGPSALPLAGQALKPAVSKPPGATPSASPGGLAARPPAARPPMGSTAMPSGLPAKPPRASAASLSQFFGKTSALVQQAPGLMQTASSAMQGSSALAQNAATLMHAVPSLGPGKAAFTAMSSTLGQASSLLNTATTATSALAMPVAGAVSSVSGLTQAVKTAVQAFRPGTGPDAAPPPQGAKTAAVMGVLRQAADVAISLNPLLNLAAQASQPKPGPGSP